MSYLTISLLLAADLAEEQNKGPDYGKASPIGLLVVVLLLVAVFFLVWSMNRHLKRVPASFDTEPEDGTRADSGSDPSTTPPARTPHADAPPSDTPPPRESAG